MVIILVLCIPVTAFVTGYFTLRGVKVGLELHQTKEVVKQVEVPKDIEPTILPPSQPPKIEFNEMMNEWLNGAQKVGD